MLTSRRRNAHVMPREAPLPPPDAAVVVEDHNFTEGQPIIDRGILTQCLEQLAKKVKLALTEDSRANNRYARKLRLHNLIWHGTSWLYEEFKIHLPVSESCWNDLDDEMIELYIARTLVAQVDDDKHQWFRIRVLFDDFMDHATKEYMDELDSGKSWFDVKKIARPAVESRVQHVSPVISPQQQAPTERQTQLEAVALSTMSNTTTSSSTSAAIKEPQIIELIDDEDEDVILIDD